MDEQRAVKLLKKGNIAGLEYLVATYQLIATRTAYLIVMDSELAQDIVQEAFLRVFHKIKTFDDNRPFKAWFLRMVVNDSIKALQRKKRHVYVNDSDGEENRFVWEMVAESFDSLEAQVEKRELQRIIWQAIRGLSPRQRVVIVQRYFLGMSEQEMADQNATAPGTIKWLLNQARQRLRTLLGGKL